MSAISTSNATRSSGGSDADADAVADAEADAKDDAGTSTASPTGCHEAGRWRRRQWWAASNAMKVQSVSKAKEEGVVLAAEEGSAGPSSNRPRPPSICITTVGGFGLTAAAAFGFAPCFEGLALAFALPLLLLPLLLDEEGCGGGGGSGMTTSRPSGTGRRRSAEAGRWPDVTLTSMAKRPHRRGFAITRTQEHAHESTKITK